MTGRLEALLALHARRALTHNQLIAALSLGGFSDEATSAVDRPTLVDLPPAVHIEPSPLLRRRWQPQPLDYQPDVRAWGVGTQL